MLDDGHFQAVVRAALRAHGFALTEREMAAIRAEHLALGQRCLDEIFPACMPAFASWTELVSRPDVDPVLWRRLPLMGALGWRQARALLSVMPRAGATDVLPVLALGAIFNAAISVIDYVADECGQAAAVFTILTDRFVDAMFDSAFDLEAEFGPAYRAADTPLRLLLALVGACVTELRRLWQANTNNAAWQALRTIIRRMLDAQRRTTEVRRASADATNSALLCALEDKSILPSLAMLHIAHLGLSASASAPAAVGGARALGAIFSRVDDLVDLLADCRRGVANTLAVRVAGNVRAQRRSVVADADLYEVVDGAAGELVCLLESRAFAAHAGWANETEGLDALVAFARECVGGWVDWRDDVPVAPRARYALPSARAAARAACDALIAGQRAGFHEAIHHLRLPRLDRRYETHAAAGWLRAIVLDALLDARDAGFAVPEAVLNAEALGILAAKHRQVRGGWNYLASVPELPPDADDNGQVLQVLARLGGAALAGSCEEPVRLHLDAAHPDGGVPTWTFDPWQATAEDEAVRRYLDVIGGAGVHPEVVANFAYGLLLFDRARFEGSLRRIAAFIEGVQKPDGSWSSRWYAGPYYGTFRAAAVLKAMLPRSPALGRAREFVIAAQRSDGGWGAPESEPLSTALALLALDELGRSEHAAFTRGVHYLAAAREAAGGRPDIAWIHFPTTDGEVVYGSSAVTTAFVLKALLAAPRSSGAVHDT